MDNQSVENAVPGQSVSAVAPGSWAYVRRGQPNEEVTVDVKNAQATEKTRGSDMVAEGMIEVHMTANLLTKGALSVQDAQDPSTIGKKVCPRRPRPWDFFFYK